MEPSEPSSYSVNAEIEIIKDTVSEHGLQNYSNIIKSKDNIYISLTKVKAKICLNMQSSLFMMQLASHFIEEFVVFTHYSPPIYRSRGPTIREDPLKQLDKADNLPNLNTSIRDSANVSFRLPCKIKEAIAMTIKEHSFIGNHYSLAKTAWYMIYATFIIAAISLFVHYSIIVAELTFTFTAYSIILLILILLLITCGVYGLSLNHNAEKIIIKPLYYLVGLSGLITFLFLFFLNVTVMRIDLYNIISPWVIYYYVGYSILFVIEIFTLFVIYKMDRFYKKYREKLVSNSLIIGDFTFMSE